jgi:hypothetical protein
VLEGLRNTQNGLLILKFATFVVLQAYLKVLMNRDIAVPSLQFSHVILRLCQDIILQRPPLATPPALTHAPLNLLAINDYRCKRLLILAYPLEILNHLFKSPIDRHAMLL